jgi:hypothetical protein
MMIFFLLAESVRESTGHLTTVLLIDPLAYGIAREAVDVMSLVEKNTAFFPLSTIFIANRLVWLSVSVLLSYIAYRKFSFKYFINNNKAHKKKKLTSWYDEHPVVSDAGVSPLVHQSFTTGGYIRKMFRMSVYEFKNVTRPVSFKIIMGVLGCLFLCYHFLWVDKYYIEIPQLPLTSLMTSARKPLAFYLYVLLMVFTVELLYKDRVLNVWQIKDSLHLPVWAGVLSKILAMAGVAFLCSLMMFVVGILIQLGNSFSCINWGLYFDDFGGVREGWLSLVMLIILASFFVSVFQNRLMAHALSIALIVFQLISVSSKAIEQYRFLYAFIPGVDDYSEMCGYGVLDKTHSWYRLLWAFMTIALLLLAIGFWNRGLQKNIKARLFNVKKQIGIGGILLLTASLAGFGWMQHQTVKLVNKPGNFKSKETQRDLKATYEKAYKYMEYYPQPVITKLNMKLDLQSTDRQINTNANMVLQNKTQSPIDTLFLEYKEFTRSFSVDCKGCVLSPVKQDSINRVFAYLLNRIMLPGDTVPISIVSSVQYRGFVQNADQQNDITKTYSFMATGILPVIGYNSDRELLENREREKRGLPKLQSRMAAQNDEKYSHTVHGSLMSDGYTGTLQINCTPEQSAIFPCDYQAVIKTDSLNCFIFNFNRSILHDWYIAAGKYKTQSCGKCNISFDPAHTYNVQIFEDAIEKSRTFLQAQLGKYLYYNCQIVEVPFFHDIVNTYGNVIAISEKLFTARTGNVKTEASIYYLLVSSMAEQIITHNLNISDVQGAGVFTRSIPEYYALQFIRQKYGDDIYRSFLSEKYENYVKGSAKEPNSEPSLLLTDNCEYVEKDKGAIAWSQIAEKTGYPVLNRALQNFMQANTGKWVNSTMLKDYLQTNEGTNIGANLLDYWFLNTGIDDEFYNNKQ